MARLRATSQAVVEFALTVSLFLLLVLATFDLARAYLAYTVVTNAVREAGRHGAAHLGESGWSASAVQAGLNLAIGVDTGALSISVAQQQQLLDGLTYISASGTYRFHSVTPLVGALLGDPINMQVSTSVLAG